MIRPQCPHCKIGLSRRANGGVFQYFCPSCFGFAIHFGGLDKILQPAEITDLRRMSQRAVEGTIPCSHCQKPMRVLVKGSQTQSVELDFCPSCLLVWLDTGEWSDLAKSSKVETRRRITEGSSGTPEVTRAYARAMLSMQKEKENLDSSLNFEAAQNPAIWKIGAAIVGLPVEEKRDYYLETPWATWTLIALCVVATAYGLSSEAGRWIYDHLAFSAKQSRPLMALTAITSFFIHGSWFHLLANGYALLVFGDNVEDHLGKGKYLLLLALATLGGHLMFLALDPRAASMPSVGASGGIFGIITYYLLRFPSRRFIILFFFRLVAVPGWFFGVFYVTFKQVLGALVQTAGVTRISHLDHLGGIIVGLIFYLFTRWDSSQNSNSDTLSSS